jgi:hypothetical protein
VETARTITASIAEGASKKEACVKAGATYASFMRWQRQKRSLRRLVEEAERTYRDRQRVERELETPPFSGVGWTRERDEKRRALRGTMGSRTGRKGETARRLDRGNSVEPGGYRPGVSISKNLIDEGEVVLLKENL